MTQIINPCIFLRVTSILISLFTYPPLIPGSFQSKNNLGGLLAATGRQDMKGRPEGPAEIVYPYGLKSSFLLGRHFSVCTVSNGTTYLKYYTVRQLCMPKISFARFGFIRRVRN